MKVTLGTLKDKGEELSVFLESRVGAKPELSGGAIEIDEGAVREGINTRRVKTYIKRFLFMNGVRKTYRVFVDGNELTVQEQELAEEEKAEEEPKKEPEKPKVEEKKEVQKEAKGEIEEKEKKEEKEQKPKKETKKERKKEPKKDKKAPVKSTKKKSAAKKSKSERAESGK